MVHNENSKKNNRPNILIIQSDSMDGRVMGCMGHASAYTPNLDELASRGVLFKNTYCNSPQCCPSRASMWSGKYVHTIESWNNYKGLSPDDMTFFKELSLNGYNTKSFGKLDFLSGYHSVSNRVHAWLRSSNILYQTGSPKIEVVDEDTEKSKKDRETVEECIEWLKKTREENSEPFILYCGIRHPHPPFSTTKSWLEKINRDKISVPVYEEKLHTCIEYSSKCKNSFRSFSEDEVLDIRRCYYAMIAEVDAMVGELVNTISELGLKDNTYIIYTSDHGEMSMEHRLWLKNSMYEASARVPLIISGPNVRKGTIVEEPASLIDMYPTLMDMAGIPVRQDLQGYSLVPELEGSNSLNRPGWVISEYHSNYLNTGCFMLRQGDWKYIAYVGYEAQLFNLKEDPEELNNLIREQPDIADKMDSLLRSIVDYEAIDTKVKEYDKSSFRLWREGLSVDKYNESMSKIFKGWDTDLEAETGIWLDKVNTNIG